MAKTKEMGVGKRCLITGGAGFIGSHLCEYLLARGYHVICMDSLLTGAVANIVKLHSERFEFIKHDVTNYIYIDGPVDYIFHMASPASPVDFERLPIPILKVGALGTHKALGLAKAKEARFLLASTSEVYGDPLVHPQREDYWGNVNPVGIRGVYDEAKRFAEALQWPTTVFIMSTPGLSAYLIPTAPVCGSMMAVPSLPLLLRCCEESLLPYLAMASKHAAFAMSQTWLKVSIDS